MYFGGFEFGHPGTSRVSGLEERARGDRYGQVPQGCNLMIETFLVLKNSHNISPEIYQNNINEILRNNSDQKATYSRYTEQNISLYIARSEIRYKWPLRNG